MGIRCVCPNGHQLNVKTFLAGKRGICPRCKASFVIPADSAPSRPEPNPQTPDLPADETSVPNDPTPISACARIEPVHNANPDRTDDEAIAPVEWYVQISDGQRFGPADDVMMQAWIADGRVAPDNLVHQPGWSDWKRAAELFPDLRSMDDSAVGALSEATGDLEIARDDLDSQATEDGQFVFESRPRIDRYRGRAAAKSRLVAIVAALGLTSVVLLATLIYVVRR